MRRICLIEDSTDIQALVKSELSSWYSIAAAGSLEEGLRLLEIEAFDLLLLDVKLPDGSGFEFCARLKGLPRTKDLPVIFLTGSSEPIDKMTGFSIGADDYIVKPFEPLELRARIQARIRRPAPTPTGPADDFIFNELRFDRVKQRVYLREAGGERDANLTPFEFRLVLFLAQHEGQVFSRASLLQHVHDPKIHVNDENIYTHISAIRKKLGGFASYLESLPRVGYRFSRPSLPLDR